MLLKSIKTVTVMLCFIITAGIVLPVFAEPVLPKETEKEIDSYIESQLEPSCIPGTSLGVVAGDKILYLKGFGKADSSGRPVTPQTPFILGSISKTFTAMAVMQLVETGKIELDAPVQRYIPWFRLADADASAKITIRNLLSHTSGIPMYGGKDVYAGPGKDSIEQLVRKQKDLKLTKPVGAEYQYSNVNFILLGAIIEAVSGISYEEYIRQHIFEPLEMKHSYVSEEAAKKDGLATGYIPIFGVMRPYHPPYRSANLPAAYIISCAEDMTHYLIALMNEGKYNGKQVISQKSIVEMRTRAATVSKNQFYGLGWHLSTGLVYHGGSTENFQTNLSIMPGKGIGIILLKNSTDLPLQELRRAIPFMPTGSGNITSGVFSLLFGEKPFTPKGMSRKSVYVVLDMVLLASIAFILIPVFRLKRWKTKINVSKFRWVLGITSTSVLNFILPGIILIGTPKLLGLQWTEMINPVPDLVYTIVILSLIQLVIGVLKASILISGVKTRQAVSESEVSINRLR